MHYLRVVFWLPQLAAAMEIKKKSAGPVDQRSGKLTEEEFTNRLNPQLDVITHMQAGAHEVEDAPGASVLRHLDAEKLSALLKRNYLIQGPGHQGEEFFAARRLGTYWLRLLPLRAGRWVASGVRNASANGARGAHVEGSTR